MVKKSKKRTITATAKRLAKNFGKLAIDAQRIALKEMVAVYEGTASTAKKVPKKRRKAQQSKRAAKKKRATS